jgi:hypothetical protein
MEQNASLKANRFRHFMEAEILLSCSQESAIDPCSEPHEFIARHLILFFRDINTYMFLSMPRLFKWSFFV